MKRVALLLLLISAFVSCQMNVNCIEGKGQKEDKTYELDKIKGLELDVPASISLQQGPQQISLTAYENYWDKLKLSVQRGILKIESDGCFKDKIEGSITIPNIEQLEINGSGKIVSNNFSSAGLEVDINGSGDVQLNVAAQEIEANINGSGNINLQGSTQDLKLEINGSGDFRALDMEILRADIEISGSGDAEINVVNDLEVQIVGSGDVTYTGQPNIKTSITGSGNVIPKN